MTTATPTAPNQYTVASDKGATLGTIISGPSGFTALDSNGKLVTGVFSTMSSAVAALGGSA